MQTISFRPPFLVFLISLFIMTLACSNSVEPTVVSTAVPASGEFDKPNEESVSQPTASVLQKYSIGDVIELGDNVLVILGWEEVSGTDFFKPDTGKKFIAVELIIVNKSQSSRNISTLLQLSIKDETNQKYDPDFMASAALDGTGLDGELAPGEKIRGKVGFQIPETIETLEFIFDASVFGSGKLFVDLGGMPIMVEPPSEILGETNYQTYNIGDTISFGSTTLVVNQVSSPSGSQFNSPKDGNRFVVVDITFENQGAESISVSSLLQMSLKDFDGFKYGVDLMATTAADGSTIDGEIAPGEAVRGQVGFQIPVSASGLMFVFDANIFGSGKAFISLP